MYIMGFYISLHGFINYLPASQCYRASLLCVIHEAMKRYNIIQLHHVHIGSLLSYFYTIYNKNLGRLFAQHSLNSDSLVSDCLD